MNSIKINIAISNADDGGKYIWIGGTNDNYNNAQSQLKEPLQLKTKFQMNEKIVQKQEIESQKKKLKPAKENGGALQIRETKNKSQQQTLKESYSIQRQSCEQC